MHGELFTDKLKCMLGEPKNQTVLSLSKKDRNYKHSVTTLKQAEETYQALNLLAEQQAFIDLYLSLIDTVKHLWVLSIVS